MRILICVTNDIVTDQRVNRIGRTLQKIPASICLAGIKRGSGLPLQIPGIQVHRFRMIFNKGPAFYMEYNIRLFLYILVARFDIVVANDLDTLPAVYLASLLRRIPLVYDSHEYFTELPELIDRKTVKKIWQWIENRILPHIRYSYTVSQSIADSYNKKYGISMKVIRNLPFRVDILPSDLPLKKNNEKVIIYQGALNMGRGLELAIRAMKYTENFRLIIAGGGYLAKELHTLVESLGLEEKVMLIGMIRPEELLQYTVQADLGISLEENKGMNYYYALPNKLFDYIQARIPVLVSDLPEMASIVNTYDVGRVIQTNDPLVLSDAFKLMLNDGDRLGTWKKNLQKASAELCWEKEENKLLEIYSRVIRDHVFSAAGK